MKLALDFLLITGILATILILLILFLKKEREFHHNVLISIFIPIVIVFLSFYAFLHKIRFLFYVTFLVSNCFEDFIGPLLLTYVKGITGDPKNNIKDNYIHFIFPVLSFLVVSIPAFMAMLFDAYEMQYLTTFQPILLFTILYSLGYCIYALFKLTKFQKLMKFNYSNLEFKDLIWVKHLLIGTILISSISVLTSIYEVIVGDMGWNIDFITIIPIVFLVIYLGYYGITQSKILIPEFLKESIEANQTSSASKKANTGVTTYIYDSKEMDQLIDTLDELMLTNKPFLDEDLTLTSLAKLLDVPDKKLSTLLNQNMESSFYDYINRLRVKEVKQRMKLPQSEKYTLLAIAYDCGFKSKSSFNRIFKNNTQMSPSEFKKQLNTDVK